MAGIVRSKSFHMFLRKHQTDGNIVWNMLPILRDELRHDNYQNGLTLGI